MKRTAGKTAPPVSTVIHALATALLVVDEKHIIVFVNHAAEMLLGSSSQHLLGKKIEHCITLDSKFTALLETVFKSASTIREYDHRLSGPRLKPTTVHLRLSPLMDESANESPAHVVIEMDEPTAISKIAGHLAQRDLSRSAGMMAAMLAHEIKNPLSGIRGAAQLLEQSASIDDQTLTTLICNEVDRVKALIDQMEIFSDDTPRQLDPVNIHEVLQYAKDVATKGFASHVRWSEQYDPSLPSVAGNRELLVQLVINLIKNAAEAMHGQDDPQIHLSTSYRSGHRFRVAGQSQFISLPISLRVEDNGPGIPESIRAHMFDPFVTSKTGGRGLGLAIVAKIVADHGGSIEVEQAEPQGTAIRIMLPGYS